MASHHAKRERVQSPTKVRPLSANKFLSYNIHDGEAYPTVQSEVEIFHFHRKQSTGNSPQDTIHRKQSTGNSPPGTVHRKQSTGNSPQ